MATVGTVTLKQADIDLLVALCKQNSKIDTKQLATDLGLNGPAASMRWTRFKERTLGSQSGDVNLKQGDIELMISLCKQFTKVDTKQLATDLGVKGPAASMRWTRFKEKILGKSSKKFKVDGNGDGNSEVKTLLTPKSDQKLVFPGSSKKRGRADVDGEEPTPNKKAKNGVQVVKDEGRDEVEQLASDGQDVDAFMDRLQEGLNEEFQEHYGEEGEEVIYADSEEELVED